MPRHFHCLCYEEAMITSYAHDIYDMTLVTDAYAHAVTHYRRCFLFFTCHAGFLILLFYAQPIIEWEARVTPHAARHITGFSLFSFFLFIRSRLWCHELSRSCTHIRLLWRRYIICITRLPFVWAPLRRATKAIRCRNINIRQPLKTYATFVNEVATSFSCYIFPSI